jgi:chemotaxis protein MotB
MSEEEVEAENHERWIVSYADFITLLFATFAALYAISITDEKKAKAFELSIQQALNASWSEKVVFRPITSNPVFSNNIATESPKRTYIVAEERCIETAEDRQKKERRAYEISEELEALTEDEDLEEDVTIEQRGEDVVISLLSAGLFSSAKADLQVEGSEMIGKLAASLQEFKDIEVRIEGHTDDRPLLPGALYRDNWELSSARATTVVNELVSKHGFDPTKLIVAGLGEHHPVAENDTEEGRALNRRIDIVIQQPRDATEEVDAGDEMETELR